MSSVKEISLKLDKIKKREENKKCFDCGEKGTTYVCIDFGTFICSRCAGILRELNFKVKGTGVSIFNQKEIDLLDKNGNEVAKKIWMAKYKEGKDKKPNNKNDDELREFLNKKYKEKKWMKKPKKNESDDEEDDDDDDKKNKKKKDKKKEKSEDESESDSSESDEDDKKKKKEKEKNKKEKEKDSKKKKDDDSSSSSESDSEDKKKKEKEKEKQKEKKESKDNEKSFITRLEIKKNNYDESKDNSKTENTVFL